MAFSEVILDFHGSKLLGSQELVYQEMFMNALSLKLLKSPFRVTWSHNSSQISRNLVRQTYDISGAH